MATVNGLLCLAFGFVGVEIWDIAVVEAGVNDLSFTYGYTLLFPDVWYFASYIIWQKNVLQYNRVICWTSSNYVA